MPISLQSFVKKMNDEKKLDEKFSVAKLKELVNKHAQTGLELGFSLEHMASNLANVAAGRSGKPWVVKVAGAKGQYRLIVNLSGEVTSAGMLTRLITDEQSKQSKQNAWSVNAGEVPKFIEWVKTKERNRSFNFKYDVKSDNRKNSLCANSIAAAAQAYSWPSARIPTELIGHITEFPNGATNLAETIELLTILRNELNQSLAENDALRHWKACWAILHWGGVTASSNLEFYALKFLAGNLISYHREAHDTEGWFDPATTTETKLLNSVRGMSAGITKIHSLIADELLIYDSRVACALTWLVERYCDQNQLCSVPPELDFCLPPERPSNIAVRNPKEVREALGSRLTSNISRPQQGIIGTQRWARDMLRASLILSEIIKNLGKTKKIGENDIVDPNEFLRYQLGLFMIGYHLVGHQVK